MLDYDHFRSSIRSPLRAASSAATAYATAEAAVKIRKLMAPASIFVVDHDNKKEAQCAQLSTLVAPPSAIHCSLTHLHHIMAGRLCDVEGQGNVGYLNHPLSRTTNKPNPGSIYSTVGKGRKLQIAKIILRRSCYREVIMSV